MNKSKILLRNILQLFEIYKRRESIKKKDKIFIKFKPLANNDLYDEIINKINNTDYKGAIEDIYHLKKVLDEGIKYIQEYDKIYLLTITTLGYILYSIYFLLFIAMRNNPNDNKIFLCSKPKLKISIIYFVILCVMFTVLFLKNSEYLYYIYTFFPIYFSWRISENYEILLDYLELNKFSLQSLKNLFLELFVIFVSVAIVRIKINIFIDYNLFI